MRLAIVIIALLITSCQEKTPEARALLQLAEAVVLEEPEDEPIGLPIHISIDDVGRIVLIDGLNPGAILFGPDGERQRMFGSRGTGPGEIESAILGVFLPEDQIGIVGEGEGPGISVFDRESGAHAETIPLRRVPFSVTRTQEGFLFGEIDFANGTSVIAFNLARRQERTFGPIPPGYEAGGPLAGIFNRVFPVPMGDGTTVLGFEPLDEVVLLGDGTGDAEVLRIPSVRRRGTPQNPQERLREAMRRAYPEVFAQGSVLSLVAPLNAGRILLIHQDLAPELPAVPEAVYMTIVDLGSRTACPDVPVPFNPDAPATFAWHRDRLGVLQQEIDIDRGEAPTVLRWYDVDPTSCGWEPLPEVRSSWSDAGPQ